MITRPVLLPAWVVAAISLASGIVIVAGSIVAIALWQVGIVKPIPLTAEERSHLEDNFRGGSFVEGGSAYRACVNGQVWFFYSSGVQATYGAGCWR